MVHSGLRNQGNGVQVDPLPKDDLICHLVSLHFALHLDVEDLQVLSSCEWGRNSIPSYTRNMRLACTRTYKLYAKLWMDTGPISKE